MKSKKTAPSRVGRTTTTNASSTTYKAIDFPSFCRIQKKYAPNTPHNTFFLILYEMGLDDRDVRRIMGITQEAIRSTRYRIQQNMKK